MGRVGVSITAPYAQRGLAAIVFPVLVFAAINLLAHVGLDHHGLGIVALLETAASCAAAGGLVHIRWWRRQSRIAGA